MPSIPMVRPRGIEPPLPAPEAVAIATGNNIITGYPDNTFKPQGNATRAEAAVVLSKSIVLPPLPPVEEKPVEIDYSSIDSAGTYGPKTGTETVDYNVTIKAQGATLQNLIIKGDLIIGKEVGDGDVTLNNIKVEGKTYIRGGGKDSIHINGGQYKEIIVDTDKIRIITLGDTAINKFKIQSGLNDISIELAKETVVKEMILDSKTLVKGQGTIKEASGSKVKDSKFEKEPDKIIATSPGGGGPSSSGGGDKLAINPTTYDFNKNKLNDIPVNITWGSATKITGITGSALGGAVNITLQENRDYIIKDNSNGTASLIIKSELKKLLPVPIAKVPDGTELTLNIKFDKGEKYFIIRVVSGGSMPVTTANVGTVAQLNSALANSNITTITLTGDIEASPTVTRSLTINFGAYKITGDVKFEHDLTGTSTLNGSAGDRIIGNLIVNTPNASFVNGVTVNGTVNIEDVKVGTWTESADGNTLTITDNSGATITITGSPDAITVTKGAGGTLTINVNPNATVQNITSNVPINIVVASNATVTSITVNEGSDGTSITNNGTTGTLIINATISLIANEVPGEMTVGATGSVDISGEKADDVKVTKVSALSVVVDGDAEITKKGGKLQFKAIVEPENASNKSVTWSVNEEGIATIDQDGLLTAIANGTVTVTATAKDGSGVKGHLVVNITGQEEPIEEPEAISFTVASDGQTNNDKVKVVQEGNTVTITGDYWALTEYPANGQTPPSTAKWIGLSIKLDEVLAGKEVQLTIGEDDVRQITLGARAGQAANEMWYYFVPEAEGKTTTLSYAVTVDGAEYKGTLTIVYVDEEGEE